jgi:two-component system, LuxR family, sensor kinase FixL
MPNYRDTEAVTPEPQTGTLHGRLLNVSRMATIGEMAAGVAHELNQPLTAIANYAHACERLLGRTDMDPADIREAVHQIALQTKRAADIIRRLRTLARNQPTERSPFNPNVLVQELYELLHTDALLHGTRLVLDLAPRLPPVLVDPGQIQQVVFNFVRNGLEALGAARSVDPTICIRTSPHGDGEVELAVTDNGPGLAPDATKRLFDPFFSTKNNGTGLGLAISSTIARAHDGSVGYRPAEPNGACFYLRLPAGLGR